MSAFPAIVQCPACNSFHVILELADITADPHQCGNLNYVTIPASCGECSQGWKVQLQVTGHILEVDDES